MRKPMATFKHEPSLFVVVVESLCVLCMSAVIGSTFIYGLVSLPQVMIDIQQEVK